jgi:hypothetical protein
MSLLEFSVRLAPQTVRWYGSDMSVFEGRCHCGSLAYRLESPSGELVLRACDCSFCHQHGTVGAAPTDGRLIIEVAHADRLQRYRFGTRSADVLLCTECGVSIGVVTEIDGRLYGVVNARSLQGVVLPESLPRLSCEGETLAARQARRRERWIPHVELRFQSAAGAVDVQ